MKRGLLLFVFCAGCLVSNGEISKKQLKEFGKLAGLDGVSVSTEKTRQGVEFEVVRVDYSSEETGLEDIFVRIAVEVKDKEKNVYLIQEMGQYGDFGSGRGDYTGEGYWELSIPYGSFDKVKVIACAVEFGVYDGEEFVPFDSDYDHVKTFKELLDHKATPFPDKCKFGYTYLISSDS